jgi:biopolymer transport protein ExbD
MAGGASGGDDDAITGINVTPLVDVTLVLLIIFMVTMRIIESQSSVPMDLPKAASGQEVQTVFSVELHAAGDTTVDGKHLTNDEGVLPLAREEHTKNAELRAVIKADASVQHGRVIHVLDLLKQAGVTKIAFGVSPIEGVAPTPAPAASH